MPNERCRHIIIPVSGSIACSHIIVRNITVRYAGNDGFNIHGDRKGIRLENVKVFPMPMRG